MKAETVEHACMLLREALEACRAAGATVFPAVQVGAMVAAHLIVWPDERPPQHYFIADPVPASQPGDA